MISAKNNFAGRAEADLKKAAGSRKLAAEIEFDGEDAARHGDEASCQRHALLRSGRRGAVR